MKRKYFGKHYAVLFTAVALSGCVTRITDLTVCTTKNMDIRVAHYSDIKTKVAGESMRQIIIFIPTGNPSVKEAIDAAIESAPGAVGLSNASLDYGFWWIPYIYGRAWYTVKGNPIFETASDRDAMPKRIVPPRTM